MISKLKKTVGDEWIETTIKKYERYSPWFKRYICGPSSVSDEEVQKFINELENEKN